MSKIRIFHTNYAANTQTIELAKKHTRSIIESDTFRRKFESKKDFSFRYSEMPLCNKSINLTISFSFSKDIIESATIAFEAARDGKKIIKGKNATVVINCNHFSLYELKEMYFAVFHEFSHFFIFICSSNNDLSELFYKIDLFVAPIIGGQKSRQRSPNPLGFRTGFKPRSYIDDEFPICCITREILIPMMPFLRGVQHVRNKGNLFSILSNMFFVPPYEIRLYVVRNRFRTRVI
jgi:hypothetical protein